MKEKTVPITRIASPAASDMPSQDFGVIKSAALRATGGHIPNTFGAPVPPLDAPSSLL